MADGLALAELVEVRLEGGGGDGEVLVQEAEKVGGIAGAGVVLNGEELDAIAGGEDEGLADAGLMGECARGVGEAGRGMARRSRTSTGAVVWLTPTRTSEPSGARVSRPRLRRPGARSRGAAAVWRWVGWLMGLENLCTAENWFAAQTKRTTRKTKLER